MGSGVTPTLWPPKWSKNIGSRKLSLVEVLVLVRPALASTNDAWSSLTGD